VIITRVTLVQQGNIQFLHTLGNNVYIYVFGDRIGAITGFTAVDCEDNRLSQPQAPVRITVGIKTVIEGFVSGLQPDFVDPNAYLVQFAFNLAVLPQKRSTTSAHFW
jgi:hypothetical protein